MNSILVKILTIFVLVSISTELKEMAVLTDHNFDTIIPYYERNNKKWLVIFHIPSCQYCVHSLKILQNDVLPKEEGETNFASVDCTKNIWTSMRFNITKLPYIVLIEGKEMYEFKMLVTEVNIKNFINEEKNVEDGLPLPPPVTTLEMAKKIISVILENMDIQLQKYVDKTPFKFKWRTIYSIILILISFFSCIYLESKLVNWCFGRHIDNRNRNNNENNTPEDKKEEENKTNTDKTKKTPSNKEKEKKD